MTDNMLRVPALGAGTVKEQAFRDYLAAFSDNDLERFPAYYTDDIFFDLTVAPPFHGKAQVIAFYRAMFARIREQVTLDRVDARDDRISASISVLFTAFEDAPDFVLQALKAGESITRRFEVVYGLRGGLISTVKVAPVTEAA